MKTTIDIADPVLEQARRLALRQGTSVKALVEQGLRHVIAEAAAKGAPFRLARASFKGQGLQPAFEGAGFDRLRDAIYDGRGA